MKHRCLTLFSALLIASCAPSTQVITQYQNPAFADRVAKVLVVGIHEDRSIRRRFEDAMVNALRAEGADAQSSTSAMGADRALNRDTLVAAAQDSGSDAVLITRLLDTQARADIEQGRSTAEAQRRHDVPIADFFRYDYAEYQDPMTVTTVRTVVLVSDLYSTAAETKIWSAESTAFEKETAAAVITEVSAGLASRLGRDGLLD
jgi:hypothetical protein